MLCTILTAAALFFLTVHIVTLAVAGWRCGSFSAPRFVPGKPPGVTVVRPLCGLETFSAATLESTYAIDYPTFEILFCVARANDPILPLVHQTMAAHPDVPARLLIGDDVISINPKLNNMVKGWREARYGWIAFIDSNVLMPPDFIGHLVAAWRSDTGNVSAPPAGTMPDGLWGHLECAFLNTYEARWQYAVDTFGNGFAQGKTLFYRKADLDRCGMQDLASEPAEDAATTKMVQKLGLRVRLAPPSPQPLGRREFFEVWGRQLRWARLRRATFLWEYLPEIFSGNVIPVIFAGYAAGSFDLPVIALMLAYIAIWWGAEMSMAAYCRWPVSWHTPLALLVRDCLMPAIWVGGLTGSSFTWKGTAMRMEDNRRLQQLETSGLSSNEGV
ncbi:MAG: ceramide glucosyltransferase [Beijerinckiaceae bacterium]|jgi:ceramide glucosyltransferase